MEPLVPGKYYHIYNRGNNREDLFRNNDNYLHFLKLYDKYIIPVAETYAWCLMRNHFHLLIKVKVLEKLDLTGFGNLSGLNKPENFLSQQFSNLFKAYSKAYNKKFNRTGSLFQRPFRRKLVDSEAYFKNLVQYIHTNPVHHGFTTNFKDYSWSSYGSILSMKPTKLKRNTVLGWFDGNANFIALHETKQDFENIKHIIIED